jgi:hypothetical protein
MFHRTYLVKMPTVSGTMPYLDIILEGPVGSADAPVKVAGGGTTPPAGWQVFGLVTGDGQFFEWQGLTLRFETLEADGDAGGFTPRARLGYNVSLFSSDTGSDGCNIIPPTALSGSLLGDLAAPFNVATFTDPSYGPVIRLMNSVDTEGAIYTVNLSIYTAYEADGKRGGGGR